MKKFKVSLLIFVFISQALPAQVYPPPAGQAGSTAIYKDSAIIKNWASACKVVRGYQDISNSSLGYAFAGDSSMALGKAQTNGVVSLGDGGTAICTFNFPIMNGPGFDFAVFENGFDDFFLELAFVEVSSDGVNYFRFPSHSLTDTVIQTGTFDSTDATKLNNLAGKYRGGYGTPFDLQELSNQPGLDCNAIRYVKIKDVVGSLNNLYSSRDSYGNKINDPWPTPFPSGGLDLDAIGVIHENKAVGLGEVKNNRLLFIYPNPVGVNQLLHIDFGTEIRQITINDLSGKELLHTEVPDIVVPEVMEGIYFITIETGLEILHKKISIISGH